MDFGVSEYTLVFRRVLGRKNGRVGYYWVVRRPAQRLITNESVQALKRPAVSHAARRNPDASLAQVFVVPICSTLALDIPSYEAFLSASGILHDALRQLTHLSLNDTQAVEITRRQIQSLVMAAEVQHIVEGMSA